MGRALRCAYPRGEDLLKLTATTIAGAYVVEAAQPQDERGWFMRTFDAEAFAAHGLDPRVVQTSVVHNRRAGTLRGMHWQADPHGEQKLVRCISGAVYDVIADLRPGSTTRGVWYAIELRGGEPRQLAIPPGVAHGYQTLADDTDLSYQMNAPYAPEAARGFRWDDPSFEIRWPSVPRRVMNERDQNWPDLHP